VNEVKRKVKSFLKMNGMDYERIDVRKEVEIFLEDMQNGLNGKPKCLEMLPTYIPMNDEIPSHEPVIALDAGGTNFRVAVVHFDDNKKPVISDFAKYSMPGMKENMSREEFLQTIVGYLEPVIHKSGKVKVYPIFLEAEQYICFHSVIVVIAPMIKNIRYALNKD
jgi:hexokinase